MNAMPTWVKVVAVLGFPVFIALYFLARDAGYIPSPIIKHALDAPKHWDQTEEVRMMVKETMRIQRQICRNTARTDPERAECDR